MASKLLLALCLVVAVAAAVPQPGAGWAGGWGAGGFGAGAWGGGATNPWIPSWISSATWYPQWGPCTTIGSSCVDCNTKLVCTKVGGLQRACADPTLPYCNLGECSATPSDECAPAKPPATTA